MRPPKSSASPTPKQKPDVVYRRPPRFSTRVVKKLLRVAMPGKRIQRIRAYKQIVKQHGVGGKVVAKKLGIKRNLLIAPIKQWMKEDKVTEKRGNKVLWGIKKMSRKPRVEGSPTADPLGIGVVSKTTATVPAKPPKPRPTEKMEKERQLRAQQTEAELLANRNQAKDVRLHERELEERRAQNPSALEELQQRDEQASASAATPQQSSATAAALNPEHPARVEPLLTRVEAPLPHTSNAHHAAAETTVDEPTPIAVTPPDDATTTDVAAPTSTDSSENAATTDTADDGEGEAGDMDIG